MKAKFIHDCDACVFLAHIDEHDLYVCPGDTLMGTSLIARYGDDGPDYKSTPAYIVKEIAVNDLLNADPHLAAALGLANFRLLLPVA